MGKDSLRNAILVLRCQRRDEAAFEELVNRWQPRLYYYLRRLVENETAVWDTLQETWLAVFQNIRKLQAPRSFPAWLYQIAHNKAATLLRKENKYIRITNEQLADYSENNSTSAPVNQPAEVVHELLEKLKLPHREVLTLHFLEGFSIKEMANIVEVSEGTVKSRLYYAKNNLCELLKGRKNV
ncbi:MAG: RNA polymerase sigma factor [Planctomycetota bacterium]|jgi:RNA polymerase sigma-70 factor (ECF subfamily)